MSVWTERPELFDRAVALWREGMTTGQIAAILGLPRGAVGGKLFRAGYRRQGHDYQVAREVGRRGAAAVRSRKGASAASGRRRPSVARHNAYAGVSYAEAAPGSHPRPWLTRQKGECSWLVSGDDMDALACCLPIVRGAFCAFHANRAYTGKAE